MKETPLRVLLVHTRYTEPGGEETAFAEDAETLEQNGHEVERLELSNEVMLSMNALHAALVTTWNANARQVIAQACRHMQPQIVHFHNTFPLLSPAVYSAARTGGAAVVQTLHNYRLVCAAGTLLRAGAPCEQCVGRVPWPAVRHGCYRASRGASLAVAAMLVTHRALRTWRNSVDAYLCLTDFAKSMLVRGGLPADKIHVKPNAVGDVAAQVIRSRAFFLYAGRLSAEKGVQVLVDAWRKHALPAPLWIAGAGPQEKQLRAAQANNVVFAGSVRRQDVLDLIANARAVLVPSICYEGFPQIIAEAYALGVPVIASRIGGLPEIVEHGKTGVLVQPNDPDAIAAAVRVLMDDNLCGTLGEAALLRFRTCYARPHAYRRLMDIYSAALAARRQQQVAV